MVCSNSAAAKALELVYLSCRHLFSSCAWRRALSCCWHTQPTSKAPSGQFVPLYTWLWACWHVQLNTEWTWPILNCCWPPFWVRVTGWLRAQMHLSAMAQNQTLKEVMRAQREHCESRVRAVWEQEEHSEGRRETADDRTTSHPGQQDVVSHVTMAMLIYREAALIPNVLHLPTLSKRKTWEPFREPSTAWLPFFTVKARMVQTAVIKSPGA